MPPEVMLIIYCQGLQQLVHGQHHRMSTCHMTSMTCMYGHMLLTLVKRADSASSSKAWLAMTVSGCRDSRYLIPDLMGCRLRSTQYSASWATAPLASSWSNNRQFARCRLYVHWLRGSTYTWLGLPLDIVRMRHPRTAQGLATQ